jgi:hypothetical protein
MIKIRRESRKSLFNFIHAYDSCISSVVDLLLKMELYDRIAVTVS